MAPNKRKRSSTTSSTRKSPKQPRAKIPRIDTAEKKESTDLQINTIINNPGFVHISQKIFGHLDDKSQLNCRLVCKSWKTQMDQPYFWIKKLDQKGQSQNLHNQWIDLLQRLEKKIFFEQELRRCLMKWYGDMDNWNKKVLVGANLVHILAAYGNYNLIKFIDQEENIFTTPKNDGWTPIHLAAANGRAEMFKFMASNVKKPNEPMPADGMTPIHLAAFWGHIEIVKFLAPQIENPNIPNFAGKTPIDLASDEGRIQVLKSLYQISGKKLPSHLRKLDCTLDNDSLPKIHQVPILGEFKLRLHQKCINGQTYLSVYKLQLDRINIKTTESPKPAKI